MTLPRSSGATRSSITVSRRPGTTVNSASSGWSTSRRTSSVSWPSRSGTLAVLAEELGDGGRELGPAAHPVVDPLGVELHLRGVLGGVVPAHLLDGGGGRHPARVRDHHPVEGAVARAHAAHTDLQHA